MPAPVRRLRLVAALVPLVALTGCAGIGQPAPYDQPGINGLVIPSPSPDPDDFVGAVDNPWLALEPGAVTRFDVRRDGTDVGSLEVEVLPDTTEVAGLAATGVRTVTDIDGDTTDETRYYSQDDDGNVWLVGVDSVAGASWRAGEDGAEAGLTMPAQPRLGDGWLAWSVPSLPEASRRVEDLSEDRVQMLDEAATTTRDVYAKGEGLVGVEDLDAGWVAVPAS